MSEDVKRFSVLLPVPPPTENSAAFAFIALSKVGLSTRRPPCNKNAQDEVCNPRHVLPRPTWVADKGGGRNPAQWSGKNSSMVWPIAFFGLFSLILSLRMISSFSQNQKTHVMISASKQFES